MHYFTYIPAMCVGAKFRQRVMLMSKQLYQLTQMHKHSRAWLTNDQLLQLLGMLPLKKLEDRPMDCMLYMLLHVEGKEPSRALFSNVKYSSCIWSKLWKV